MNVVVVLPVKALEKAKARLGESGVGRADRLALATGMLTDVLEALELSRAVDDVVVVTRDPQVEVLARGYGNQVIAEDLDDGHSEAAEVGARWALREGAFHALLLAGDTPAIDHEEIDVLADMLADGPEVVIVPDRHGTGTNALLLTPPDVIRPSFGPGSRERHEQLAREAGAKVRVAQIPSLQLDIDTADDLDALAEWVVTAPPRLASHTRGALSRVRRP